MKITLNNTEMKKILFVFAAILLGTAAFAQNAPWKFITMEEVARHGGNAEWDDETCTATFTGSSDRWIDLPGVSGDINGHTDLTLNVLKSEVILSVFVRYKDEEGKTQQVKAATLYRQTGKPINKLTALKIDLTNDGEITEEMLANVTSIRVSMAKPCVDKDEPWSVTFADSTLK